MPPELIGAYLRMLRSCMDAVLNLSKLPNALPTVPRTCLTCQKNCDSTKTAPLQTRADAVGASVPSTALNKLC